MKRVLDIADTERDARRMREIFVARPAERSNKLGWGWPPVMRHAGACKAVMYTSDKWHDVGDYEDYKHVAEAPQDILFVTDFGLKNGSKAIVLHGEEVQLREPMPSHVAVLAPLLGIQVQLFDRNGKLGKSGDRLLEVDIARATLGGARHPDTGEAFLVIYRGSGPVAIVTGKELDVEKDGITG